MNTYSHNEKTLLKQLSDADTFKKLYHDAMMMIIAEAMNDDMTMEDARAEKGVHEKSERRIQQIMNSLVE